jgi:hypothetical protein
VDDNQLLRVIFVLRMAFVEEMGKMFPHLKPKPEQTMLCVIGNDCLLGIRVLCLWRHPSGQSFEAEILWWKNFPLARS